MFLLGCDRTSTGVFEPLSELFNTQEVMDNKDVVVPIMVVLILITGFFLSPLTLLLYVQSCNFIYGQTTSERLGRQVNED